MELLPILLRDIVHAYLIGKNLLEEYNVVIITFQYSDIDIIIIVKMNCRSIT